MMVLLNVGTGKCEVAAVEASAAGLKPSLPSDRSNRS